MAQRVARMGKAQIAGETFGADPGPGGEQPLKMKRAEMRRGGDIGQLRRIAIMRCDVVNPARNAVIVNVLLAMHGDLLTVCICRHPSRHQVSPATRFLRSSPYISKLPHLTGLFAQDEFLDFAC